jgi:hypothetical protein
VVGGRVPKIDEDTLKILSEEALIVYLNYLDQLKTLFTSFVHQNFNAAGKKVRVILFSYKRLLTGRISKKRIYL